MGCRSGKRERGLIGPILAQIQIQTQRRRCLRFRHSVHFLGGSFAIYFIQTIEAPTLSASGFGRQVARGCSLDSKWQGVELADISSSTFGVFSDRISTESAIEALRNAGFRSTDISALFPDEIRTRSFSPEKRTKAVYCAAAGCGSGAALGGVAGQRCGRAVVRGQRPRGPPRRRRRP